MAEEMSSSPAVKVWGRQFRAALALFLLLGLAACSAEAPRQSLVVARVGEQPITLNQFISRAAFMGLGSDPATLAPDLRKAVLEDLVKRKLVLAQADERGIELTQQELVGQEEALRRDLGEEAFKRTLALHGITIEQWRQELGLQTLTEKTLNLVLMPRVRITPQEIEEYYQQNRGQYQRPEQVLAQHALLPSRALAQELVNQMKKGKDMGQAAAQLGTPLAQGDRPTWLSRGHMPPELEKKVFSLKAGQLAGPLPSSYGFHVVRVMDKRPASKLSLAQVEPRIRLRLTTRAKEVLAADWLSELLSGSNVWYHKQFIASGHLVDTENP